MAMTGRPLRPRILDATTDKVPRAEETGTKTYTHECGEPQRSARQVLLALRELKGGAYGTTKALGACR